MDYYRCTTTAAGDHENIIHSGTKRSHQEATEAAPNVANGNHTAVLRCPYVLAPVRSRRCVKTATFPFSRPERRRVVECARVCRNTTATTAARCFHNVSRWPIERAVRLRQVARRQQERDAVEACTSSKVDALDDFCPDHPPYPTHRGGKYRGKIRGKCRGRFLGKCHGRERRGCRGKCRDKCRGPCRDKTCGTGRVTVAASFA